MAIFTVTNISDDLSDGSLRNAIEQANLNTGEDTIVFDSNVTGSITLQNGALPLEDDLIIDGPGASQLTIDAQGNSRIFDTTESIDRLEIHGLTLTGGYSQGNGGVLIARNELLVKDSVLTGNTAASTSKAGGAIWGGNIVTIEDSTLTRNSSAGSGGAITFSGEKLEILNSEISENTGGGAITVWKGPSGNTTLNIEGSTFLNNERIGSGAGAIEAIDIPVTITDTIISGNTGGRSEVGGFRSAEITIGDSLIIDDQIRSISGNKSVKWIDAGNNVISNDRTGQFTSLPIELGTDGLDTLTGTDADEVFVGFSSADEITTGDGRDTIIYRSVNDGNDTITDFTLGQDKIDLQILLSDAGLGDIDPIAEGYLTFETDDVNQTTTAKFDSDGVGSSVASQLFQIDTITDITDTDVYDDIFIF